MSNKKPHKILFLSPYPFDKAPSQRLKFEQYYPIFQKEGYELTTSSFMDEDLWNVIYKKGNYLKKTFGVFKGYVRRIKDLFKIRSYDLVYVHLWVTPFGGTIFEQLVSLLSRKMVFDIDDMVFLGHSSEANLKLAFLKGRNKPLLLIKKADHVITCTPKLDEFARRFNNRTTDISSTINTEIYRPKSSHILSTPIIIGWSGSHSTSKYLHLLTEVFRKLSQKYSLVLKVIGDGNFKMEGVQVQASEWDGGVEVHELKTFDVGVYPLPDEEWVYGKSGLKALQYMSLGIPTVASDIGANKRIIGNGKNGFLVNGDEQWLTAIESLIESQQLRAEFAEKSVKTVEDKFSVASNKDKYLDIFKSLTEK